MRAGMEAALSGTLATMGPAVPYAIGAKFAHPDRPVIALVGDGAMQMNGLAELITIAKYRDRWPDQRLVVVVLNNRDLNQVTWEQRAMSGDPKFERVPGPAGRPLRALGRADRAAAASASNARRRWARLGRGARAPTGRRVLEVVSDPEVPPLPPHITHRAGQGHPRRRCARATRHAGGSSPSRIKGKLPEFVSTMSDGRDAMLRNFRRGRVQRSLAARDGARARCRSALEIYFEHFRGSFGDKWMWTPVALSPAAGRRGCRRRRVPSGRRAPSLPAVSALYCLDGLIGVYTHVQGVAQARRVLASRSTTS